MNWDKFKSKLSLHNESDVHPHIGAEFSNHFSSNSFESTEIEYLDLIYGVVRAAKPKMVLETGTFHGISAVAIAYALKENLNSRQDIKFYTVEKDPNNYQISLSLFTKESVDTIVNIVNSDTIDFISNISGVNPFDFVFFDSSRKVRVKEFYKLMEKSLIKKGAFLVFHDTSVFRTKSKIEFDDVHEFFLKGLAEIEKVCESRIDFTLSRGLTIFKY